MPRASTRSQRPSQTQPRAGQSQRRKRTNEEEEEDRPDAGEDVMDEDENGGGGEGGDEIARRANDLARIALFSEHRRTALRRDDINKKVLGSNTRVFAAVLEKAQEILRRTFGMELVELHRGTDDGEDDQTTGTGLKKKATSTGTKSYILRSTLDPVIIEQASLSDAAIIEEESVDMPDEDEADDEASPKFYGSLIAWSSSDQLGATGILYVFLALVLVNGRVISDMDLRSHLKRLRLTPTTNIPYTANTPHHSLTVETYLVQLQRQGYLDRLRVGDAPKKAGAGKRARGGAAASQNPRGDGADEAQWEWRWGPRAAAEVGEQSIAKFIGEFMVERSHGGDMDVDDDDDEDDGHQAGRARREREKAKQEEANAKLAKVMRGIERAAGGTLQEAR